MASSTAEPWRRGETQTERKRTMHFVRVAVSGATERHEQLACIDAIGLPEAVNDPHAVRRLRHRAWAHLGQEMRSLQHALLWG